MHVRKQGQIAIKTDFILHKKQNLCRIYSINENVIIMILKKTSIFTILNLIPCISLYSGMAVADTCNGKGWYRWEKTSVSKDWCMPCPAGCYCDQDAEKKKIFTGGDQWRKCEPGLENYGIYYCGNGYTSDSTTVMCTGLGKQSYCRGPQLYNDCYFQAIDTQKKVYKGSLGIKCEPGTYTKQKYAKCQPCKTGYICPGGRFVNKQRNKVDAGSLWSSDWELLNENLYRSPTVDDGIYLCPSGKVANTNHSKCVDKKDSKNNYICKAGQYLPANATSCSSCRDRYYCPGGTFEIKSFDQGLKSCAYNEKPNQNQTGCETSSVRCDAGRYLPANATSCSNCKNRYYVCTGGTFEIKHFDQGIARCEYGYIQNEAKTQCVYVADIDYNCEVGYYLPANMTQCERCSSSKKYCPGGTFRYYDLDQGIYTCPYASVANSDHSSCVLYLSQDYMKYGPNGANTDWKDQCWTQKTDEDYTRCIYSEKNPKKHINSFISTKKYNKESEMLNNNLVDMTLKNNQRSIPEIATEEKNKRKNNTPVVVNKGFLEQTLVKPSEK